MKILFFNKLTKKFLHFIISILLISYSVYYFRFILFTQDTIPGFGLDPFFCLFVIKNNAINLINLDFFNFANLPFFYPKKLTLGFSDPMIFHSILYSVYSIFLNESDIIIRFVFFTFFILNWIAAGIFLNVINTKTYLVIILSWVFAFSIFFQVQSAHFQNLITFPVFLILIPIFKLNLNRLYAFFLVSIGISIIVTTNLYFFFYTTVIFFSSIVFISFYKKKPFLKNMIYPVLGYIFGIFISVPIIKVFYEVKFLYPEIDGIRGFEEKVFFSSRWNDYFNAIYLPSFYSDFKSYFYAPDFERSSFSGIFGLIIIAVILLKIFRKKTIFKTFSIDYISILFLSIGIFLSSGPLITPLLYIVASKVIPGLSEIRAIGRAGFVINIAIFFALYSFFKFSFNKNFKCKIISMILLSLLFLERMTLEFPFRFVEYHMPIHREAKIIYERNSSKNKSSASESIFVIGKNVEDFVRIPFYLNLESGVSTVNGYSGYNPKEWNHAYGFYSENLSCKKVLIFNDYLFQNSDFILIDKNSNYFLNCKTLSFKNFKLKDETINLLLYKKNSI